MDRQLFNRQLHRLKTQWPHSYGEERVSRIWATFQKVSDIDFEEMVHLALDTMRSAPLVDDLCNLEREVKKRRSFYRVQNAGGIGSVVEQAAQANRRADPEYVKNCVRLLKKKMLGQLTTAQFLEGCAWLDSAAERKNPAGGRVPKNETP